MSAPLKIQKSLPLYKKPEAPGLNKKMEARLRNAAGLYEKHFLGEMVKAMRGTVQKSALTEDSMAQKIYADKMDQQYVEKWGDVGGVGLGELIYQQLKDRFYPTRGPLRNPSAPMPVDKGRIHEIKTEPSDEKKYEVLLEPETKSSELRLVSPWAGEVTAIKNTPGESQQSIVEIKHGNNLVSRFGFHGRTEAKLGQRLAAGQSVGAVWSSYGPVAWKVTQNG